MRSSKSILAGVAAGALGLALIPFVPSAAQAAGTIAGTATPIRYTGAGNAQEATVPAGAIYWAKADANVFSGTPKLYFDGTTAPGGKLYVYSDLNTQVWSTGLSALDDTTLISLDGIVSTDDSAVFLKADTAGRYTGKIANGSDTVTFDFTTAGAPAAIALTPATQSVLVGGEGELTSVLVDASGNPTQPSFSSAVGFTQSGAGGTLAPTSVTPSGGNPADTAFALGAVTVTDSALASGTTTVTATGSGDLLGKSASATISASGAISDDTVVDMAVTSPASGVWNKPSTTSDWVAQVKTGTTALTVSVEDTTVNTAGNPIRLKISTDYGTVTAGGKTAVTGTPVYVDATPSAGVATLPMTLGGAAAVAGNTITVQQVDVTDTAIDGVTKITISLVVPDVTAGGVTVTPSGETTTKLGNTTNVVVSVDDSLGDPAAGQVITAYRTSVGLANLLSSATTGADGSATVTVTNASTLTAGSSETYKFTVSGISSSVAIAEDLTVNYTETGNITTMTVTPHSASAFDAAGTLTVTTVSAITVPSTSGLIGTTMSTGTYNPTSEASAGAPTPVVDFRVATSPNNAFSVSVPEGVKVSTTAPTATTLWSDGERTVNASYDDSIYMWSTKVGTHTYTVESGGLTATGTLVVANSANDAYNIGISPATSRVGKGSIFTVTLSLTDMFGNPVQASGTASGDDTGAITVTASGEVLLAGFATSNTFATGENGTVTVTAIAGNSAGTGALTATAKAGTATPAWQTTYTAPTGKSAPVVSAAGEVIVSGDAEKTITIVGSRTTVKGKPGIMIDGVTTGIEDGKTVIPYFRFPGQTEYTQGTARPVVNDDEFTWQRKTGKKFYAYVTNDDGAVKSNRVIIPAK